MGSCTTVASKSTTVDFEEGVPFYQIKVTVNDGVAMTRAADGFLMLLTTRSSSSSRSQDVNEPPMFPTMFPNPDGCAALEAPKHDVLENTMAGYPTNGLIIATDPDDGDAVTYRLANAPGSTDAASFTIDDNTGQLRVKAPLDYETKREYRVIVHATDNKNARGTRDTTSDDEVTVTITVDRTSTKNRCSPTSTPSPVPS